MYKLARSVLFRFDAEVTHELGIRTLQCYGALPGDIRPLPGGAAQVMGLDFHNRVGLAAGLDKSAVAVAGLARLGFAFVEVGTVTPRPQSGNPRPRLFRLPGDEAIINRMGFNNDGVVVVSRRLRRLRRSGVLQGTILGVNIGKNKDTPLAAASADYTTCLASVYPYADYVTLNLSSPNTPGLRQLQAGNPLRELLNEVVESRLKLTAEHGRKVPIVLKVAPDLAPAEVDEIATAILEFEIDGLAATNTTVSRPGLATSSVARESGGLSGRPLAPLAAATVTRFHERLAGRVAIIGVGGIFGPEQAKILLIAGASLVQIYTGFIYRGPAMVKELVMELASVGDLE